MSKLLVPSVLSIALLGVIAASPAPAQSQANELVSSLMELGVTKKQASGGAGALMDFAKQGMPKSDYAQVAKALPEADSLRKLAPSVDSVTGSLGSVSSALGSGAEAANRAANLASQFKQLGLGKDMIQKFVPPLLQYAQDKGGSAVMKLLQSALI